MRRRQRPRGALIPSSPSENAGEEGGGEGSVRGVSTRGTFFGRKRPLEIGGHPPPDWKSVSTSGEGEGHFWQLRRGGSLGDGVGDGLVAAHFLSRFLRRKWATGHP